MGYGGLVVAAMFAVLILLVFPYAVDRQTALTQSRESDRFSPRMRLLRAEGPPASARGAIEAHGGGRRSQPLLSVAPQVARQDQEDPGDIMTSQEDSARRPRTRVHAEDEDGAQSQTLHEVTRLRARRAARLSRERAAGRRRMLASALLAAATLAVVALAAATLVAWAWVALPAATLAAALGLSRGAAVRSERAQRAEDVEMRVLREKLRAHAAAAPALSGARHGAEVGGVSSPGPEAREAEPAATGASVDEAVAEADAAPRTERAELDDAPRRTGSPRREWSVPDLPAPSYAVRGRVEGRSVHPDTDIRGIPQVEASVPARPVAGGQSPRGVRSTEEVVASQPVAFDLEAVLDARRAE
ncbi:MAG: hypothetical protein LKI27_08930 [Actinomyces sp.]|nr:hypothetical protein [Actinomyces sp.]MCI1663000.1 hypothetical protein [Actinomyces sp.]